MTKMLNEGLPDSDFGETQFPRCVIIAPTRELANQIYADAYKFSRGTNIRTVACYGGTSMRHSLSQIENGCHIVVGTPGRVKDIIERKKVSWLICKCKCQPRVWAVKLLVIFAMIA